ncbi:hypothetical protein DT076_16720 [Desertihabitans brevis]|uniref:Uncharacterized protein n=1 Tax=Desertihabitans brevis TaxID=2268447 RepID=A0A367YR66_9ACTN|nr:hypothetical protein [Desertihabitans brevis]RCK68290.1 hypothetical protein DT076_16720 [Desertihabitans brevis]
MTATVTDVDLLAHLDWTPACQLPDCEHDHPEATHRLLILPAWTACRCLDGLLVCTPCGAMADTQWRGSRFPALAECPLCKAEDVVRSVPLEVRAL